MSIATISSTGKQSGSGGINTLYSNRITMGNTSDPFVNAYACLITSDPINSLSDLANYIISNGVAMSATKYRIICGGTYINAVQPAYIGDIDTLDVNPNDTSSIMVNYHFVNPNYNTIGYSNFSCDNILEMFSNEI